MSTPSLLQPVRLGELDLPNRFVMAPLTRCRAGAGRVPTELMAEYYAQRAGAGLIVTEATSISPQGVGYPDTPGIWSEEQVEGWKKVTAAVHAAGGRIALQLWHVGRISDPVYLDGALPVAPSALRPPGHVSLLRPQKDYEVPRALERDELPGIIADYRRGAENAHRAGFDAVELHGANGYLLDQFLQDSSNRRDDDYGGPVARRARLMLEAVDAAVEVWGPGRVGLHLAPKGDSHGMGDSDPAATFGYVAAQARERGLAFLFTREGQAEPRLSRELRRIFGGGFIANQGLTLAEGEALVAAGAADAIAWGQAFIANPDLPERHRLGAELNAPDPSKFYQYDDPREGYTDYPALDPAVSA